jgi:hypothetical protein
VVILPAAALATAAPAVRSGASMVPAPASFPPGATKIASAGTGYDVGMMDNGEVTSAAGADVAAAAGLSPGPDKVSTLAAIIVNETMTAAPRKPMNFPPRTVFRQTEDVIRGFHKGEQMNIGGRLPAPVTASDIRHHDIDRRVSGRPPRI